jgi:hypothetical protein
MSPKTMHELVYRQRRQSLVGARTGHANPMGTGVPGASGAQVPGTPAEVRYGATHG